MTTDFAVAVFYEGIKSGKYECYVNSATTLPMMYMDDAIEATLKIMSAPAAKIKIRTSYNLSAISFSAKELVAEINKHIKVKVSYKPDFHQKIADSWPKSIDDKNARRDWGWRHKYNLTRVTKEMITNLQKNPNN